VAKRKRTKNKTRRIAFKHRPSPKRKKQKLTRRIPSLLGILKVLVVVCICVAAGASLYFMKKYIRSTTPVQTGPLVLQDVPEWVGTELKTKILAAAGYKNLELDEKAARLVAENLESVGWLDKVKIQTTHESIIIKGKWRKPLALVKSGLNKFYVDAERVVLDFVPMPNLPVVQVKGVSITKTPAVGRVLESQDITAAVTVLDALDQMDKSVTPDRPLLNEIESIDVSNFNGRQNRYRPHIVLYAKDNTEIIWGAEFGTWQKHLEATDEEKLAKLYSYYKEYGSLLGGAKYINLRDPQDNIPQPIDRY